jgi:uncharacterized protein YodC (DUF2158 family)
MSNEEFPFKIGTVVKLKSGGPDMTVEEFNNEAFDFKTKVKCVFFLGEKRTEEDFVPETLREVTRPVE